MNGFYPVDLFKVTEEAASYLEARGAKVTRYNSWGEGTYHVQFPDCKPSSGHNHHDNTVRVFFPDEDTIMMFSIVYGHLIQNCRIKSIQDMIVNERILKQ